MYQCVNDMMDYKSKNSDYNEIIRDMKSCNEINVSFIDECSDTMLSV